MGQGIGRYGLGQSLLKGSSSCIRLLKYSNENRLIKLKARCIGKGVIERGSGKG